MKLYILASLIIFILVIFHNLRKAKKLQTSSEMSFWEKERLANATRRRSLDGLDYIKIPLDDLPMQTLEEDEGIAECLRTIRELSTEPVVNFTGLTNTDLKLEYGTANITVLTQYDQNYTLMVSTLQKWADQLYNKGYLTETRQILEFAVSTHTDVSRSYDLLSDLYLQTGETDKIAGLIQVADTLNSLNKKLILRHLQEKTSRSGSCQ